MPVDQIKANLGRQETITVDGKEIKQKSHQHLSAPSADLISYIPAGIEKTPEEQKSSRSGPEGGLGYDNVNLSSNACSKQIRSIFLKL